MKIILFARSLALGGTERQLVLLAKGLHRRGHRVGVALFFAGGTPLEAELGAAGIRLIDLRKKGRWDVLAFLARLIARLRAERPEIVYSFLPVPNIVSLLAKPFLKGARVVLGVRASNMDLRRYDWLSRLSYWLEGKLARGADLAIANSEPGRATAIARGFPARATVVVPNGVDGLRFRPDPALRRRTRDAWKIGDSETLIGVVARLDPMKGHATFLEAARLMLERRGDFRFACVGSGSERAALARQADELQLGERLLWVPERTDVESVLNALDLLVLPSIFGEGFSNILAEALACGVPCVATDVGAAREILGDETAIVPPGDAQALAEACLRKLTETAAVSAEPRRARVLSLFGADAMVERTEALLAQRL